MGNPSLSYETSPAMGSHSVTWHPTQVNAPRLNPRPLSWYSIYLPRRDGRLSWPKLPGNVPVGNRTHDLSTASPTLRSHQVMGRVSGNSSILHLLVEVALYIHLDSLPVSGGDFRVGTAIVNLWAAAYKMVKCFVFGWNDSSQKNCCSFYRFPARTGRKGSPKWFYRVWPRAGGNHSRIAWDGRNAHLRAQCAVITLQCLNAFTNDTQDVQIQ